MDVDIDLKTNFRPEDIFPEAVLASMVQDGELRRHQAGAYFQNIPQDPITGLAAIPYKEAESIGYFKVDFLHLSLLDSFQSKEEIRALLKLEPEWVLLKSHVVVSKLFQLHRHFDVIQDIEPTSVQELADCIAIIRPGKRYLLPYYLKDKVAVRKQLYQPSKDGKAYFKKSHAIAYALTIVLQLHLINAGVL